MADIGAVGDAPTAEEKPMEATTGQPSEPGTEMPPEGAFLEEGEEEVEGEGPPPPPPKSRFDFIFDDVDKKKKKKKEKPPPVKRPPKSYYEQIVTELNRALAQLTKKVMQLDEFNFKRTTELVETNATHKEISEHLKRVLGKHKQNLTIEEDYNEEIIRKRKELDIESKERIKALQMQHKAAQSQLLGEINMLSTKLSTLRVFSDAREELLRKLSDMEVEYKESDEQHKDRLYAMQQKAVVERNKLDEEAKTRYTRVVDDFDEWREVRNAAYTRRLLSENSDLRRKYNKLVPLNLRKENELNAIIEKTANIKETYAAVFDITKQLEDTQEKRNGVLEKLEKFRRFYRVQVVLGSKYRRLYEAVKKHERDEDKKYTDEKAIYGELQAQNAILMEKLQTLKQAERDYLLVRQQYDYFVNSVKEAIYSLCNLPEYAHWFPETFTEYDSKRNVILSGLAHLLTLNDRKLTAKALLKAQYYRGYLGFMPFDSILCQIFKCKSCTDHGDWGSVPSFCTRLTDWSSFEDTEVEQDNYSDPGLMCLK